jgi:large subunit ribosomal protein L35
MAKFKLKTKKKAAKRFRVTKNGKVIAAKSGRRHLLGDKDTKEKRQMRNSIVMQGKPAQNISKVLLPYS